MNHNIDPNALKAVRSVLDGRKLNDCEMGYLSDFYKSATGGRFVFMRSSPGRFWVGDVDNPVVLKTKLKAIDAVWEALKTPGCASRVRAADHVAPGAQHVARTMRAGIKRVARYLETEGHRLLASEVRNIKVEDGWVIAPSRRFVDLWCR